MNDFFQMYESLLQKNITAYDFTEYTINCLNELLTKHIHLSDYVEKNSNIFDSNLKKVIDNDFKSIEKKFIEIVISIEHLINYNEDDEYFNKIIKELKNSNFLDNIYNYTNIYSATLKNRLSIYEDNKFSNKANILY